MLHALLTIIAGFVVFALCCGLLQGIVECLSDEAPGRVTPVEVRPLPPPSLEFWVGLGVIVGGLAISILLYHIAG